MLPLPVPQGLPAPSWLLQALLILTFFLHVVPMTITLGGTWIALVAGLLGRRRPEGALAGLARQLAGLLPTVTAFTITLGVAPLLFLQLLYGLFFYPSTILLAWSWLAVIGLLLVGYGGIYTVAWRRQPVMGWKQLLTFGLSSVTFLLTAFIYTNVMTLMLVPGRWAELFTTTLGAGTGLNLADATLLPRFAHILLGVVAAAGMFVVALGQFDADPANGRQVQRFGLCWLVPAVLLQGVVAPWYLGRITGPGRAGLQGLGLTILVPLAVGLGALALVLALLAWWRGRAPVLIGAAAGALLLVVAVLTVLRHMVRQAILAPLLPAEAWRVDPQTVVFVLFVVVLLAAVGVIGWLLLRFRRAQPVL